VQAVSCVALAKQDTFTY